jgi:hypothetical protein
MQEVGGFLLLGFLGLVLLLSVALIVSILITLFFTKTGQEIREDGRKQEQMRKDYEAEVAATSRTQLVDGKWKTVTSRTFSVVQNKKTRRKAAVIHLSRMGRHYYVQPLLKDHRIGASKPHWTRLANWETIGEVQLPFIEGPADEPTNLDTLE